MCRERAAGVKTHTHFHTFIMHPPAVMPKQISFCDFWLCVPPFSESRVRSLHHLPGAVPNHQGFICTALHARADARRHYRHIAQKPSQAPRLRNPISPRTSRHLCVLACPPVGLAVCSQELELARSPGGRRRASVVSVQPRELLARLSRVAPCPPLGGRLPRHRYCCRHRHNPSRPLLTQPDAVGPHACGRIVCWYHKRH